jgi:hypothetical protein
MSVASLARFCGRVYAIRVHPGPVAVYGADWDYGCVVRDDRPGFLGRLWLRLRGRPVEKVAFLCLTHVAPTMDQIEAMKVALRAAGYEWAVWERWKKGRVRLVRVRL